MPAGARIGVSRRRRLVDLLHGLGIGEGDVVYLHTSLRHIEYLELSGDELLSVGVPQDWTSEVLGADEDRF